MTARVVLALAALGFAMTALVSTPLPTFFAVAADLVGWITIIH
jgi:hypothetical protein